MLKRLIPQEALFLVAIMWAVFIVDLLLPGIGFDHFGIRPRRADGLSGILFSPFLHGGLSHIVFNSIPLIVLSTFIRFSLGSRGMLVVMICGVIGSGLGTWLFSSGGLVIGASGLVYALIGFLLADAYFSPSVRSWVVAILSFVLYGGTLFSLFTFLPFISWAAHFWGAISGIVIAMLLKNRSRISSKPGVTKKF